MVRSLLATGWRPLAALVASLALVLSLASMTVAQGTPAATPLAGAPLPEITLGEDEAAVAVVHAAAAAPSVDILVDDAPVLTAVEFGSVSDFLTVPSGDHNIKVVPAGGTANQAVIDSDVTVDAGKVYAIVAANGTEAPEIKAFEIDNEPVSDGNARVVAVHAAPDVPALDVAPTGGGDPVITDLSYFNSSDANDLPAGQVTLDLRPTGETTALVTLPAVTLTAGTSVLVVVTTDASGAPIPLLIGTTPGSESEAATPAPAA